MTHTIHVPPGIGATIYGNLPRDVSPELVAACDHVTLHTAADASDVQTAAKVRQLGCERVWLAIPGNYLARKSDADAVKEIQRCAHIALDMGAEVFEINGEGSSDGKKPGDWIAPTSDPFEGERLEALALLIAHAAKDVMGESCALGWTSHDGTGFRIPRRFLSRIDVHAPQHYPAYAGHTVSQRELEKRMSWSRGQWETLADRGKVPGDIAPYGARWAPYLQGHGHTPGALVWGLCEAPVVRLWAYPSSWSPEAIPALRRARAIRANVDVTKPDVVARWQQAQGLEPDGVVGPKTLAALGA